MKELKEYKINKYDCLLFVLILCTAAGMWGGAYKPARIFSIFLAIPMLFSFVKVKIRMVNKVIQFFLFLVTWSFVSLLWTPSRDIGISEWGNMILRMLFFLEIVIFGLKSKNTFNTLVNAWLVAYLITAIIAIWELNTGNHLEITRYTEGEGNINLGGGNIMTRQFASATFFNYNSYVTYVCYCLPFLFSFAIRWTTGMKQLVAIFPIALALYVLILNASRGGIVVFFIYAVVFSNFKLSKSKLSIKISFLALSAILVYLFAYFWELMSFYLGLRMESEGMYSSRFRIWVCCWQALVETDFVGCGIGGVIAALTNQHAFISLPHNFFIEVLLEFGIIIFIWMIYLMWKTFRMGHNIKDRAIKYVRISSLIAIPFLTIIDSGYVQNIGIWAFLGSLMAINIKSQF